MASKEQLRKEYKEVMGRSGQSAETFNKAVKALLAEVQNAPGELTPEDYVWAAKNVSFVCDSCMGSGMYVSYVENGVPVGNGGICYRCAGKGRQTDKDIKRNWYYDSHRDI